MAQIVKRSRSWYYRFTDANGRRVMRKGCPDRRETEAMATMAEAEAAKARAGLIDPKAGAYATHEAWPLAGHLADFHAYLIGKGSTRQHADLTRNRVARLIDLARTRRISELTPSRVQAALKAVRDAKVMRGEKVIRDSTSLRSVHHYTRAVKGFSRWLWRDGRAREDALAHLTSPNPDPDRRHERRALTPKELTQLIQAAESGGVVLKTSGADRAALYRLAAGTGFRAGELRSLTPESFDLAADPSTVMVKAAYSKHRRDDVQPIRPDLAAALRPWVAGKPPGRPVFGNLTKHTAYLVRADLEAAGLPYRDASGRVADFHALRHSYITALAMSRAPVKVVQSLARHSTPTLTLGTYAHVGLYDQTAALDALPDLTLQGDRTEAPALATTGTEGTTHQKTFAPSLRLSGDGSGRNEVDTGGADTRSPGTEPEFSTDCNPREITVLDAQGRGVTAADGAEGVGFEPTDGVTRQRFSRPSQSTALAPLRSAPANAHWPTSLMTSSATKIGTSTVTATAIASLGRESTSMSSPLWRMRSLA